MLAYRLLTEIVPVILVVPVLAHLQRDNETKHKTSGNSTFRPLFLATPDHTSKYRAAGPDLARQPAALHLEVWFGNKFIHSRPSPISSPLRVEYLTSPLRRAPPSRGEVRFYSPPSDRKVRFHFHFPLPSAWGDVSRGYLTEK